MTKRYLEVTIICRIRDQTDEEIKLEIVRTLRKAMLWLDIANIRAVPLEPCECDGWKREGALMCDACAGGVTR